MRADYWSLPAALQAALTSRFGVRVASAASQPGGFSGGLAARLVLADGRTAFVKGCHGSHPILAQYEVEGWFGRRLREGPDVGPAAGSALLVPAPLLLDDFWAADWYVLVFEDIDGHDADLGDPGDLAACLELFDRLAAAAYPSSYAQRIPPVAVSLGHLASGWQRIAEAPPRDLDPWAAANLGRLCALERAWAPHSTGSSPVHTDLHPGNVLVTAAPGGRRPEALAVDWTRPSAGADWVDPLLFCLRDPAVRELPGWFRARYPAATPALTAFLAGAAGHWTDAARLEPPDYAPGLRGYEAERARKALAWLRTGLEDVAP
ncbi:phosphotransferase [Yinghuangia soli]|uniref:Aminoglycoside phosphotransferase domain-containing protein n=1 Tax=Yinghuangia soli TaxID=2908204 RepID=A0AA41U2F9_9ACTN|nr:phosphotransferase [Yinghuangia soli]MCF2530640.1 hypothetical protein [Yinghuangia soli]